MELVQVALEEQSLVRQLLMMVEHVVPLKPVAQLQVYSPWSHPVAEHVPFTHPLPMHPSKQR